MNTTAVFVLLVQEGAAIEAVQALFLLLAAILALRSALLQKRRDLAFTVYLGFALVMFLCALREVPVARLGTAPFFPLLSKGLRLAGALSALAWLWHAWPRRRDLLAVLVPLLRQPAGLLASAGVLFYLLGWPFDKGLFPLDRDFQVVCEEFLELLACSAFAFCALLGFVVPMPASGSAPVAFRSSPAVPGGSTTGTRPGLTGTAGPRPGQASAVLYR
jgi:hypothetical protein